MYQKYRPQKKTSPWWPKVIAIIFAVIVLWLGIWYLPKMWAKVEQQEITSMSTGNFTDRYVGKKVELAGTISTSSDQSTHTHVLTLSGGATVNIFSSTLDLNNYIGFVYTQGSVNKFDGKAFVVDINAVGNSPEALQSMSLPTSTTSRIIPNLALKIDMKDQNNISYTTQWDKFTFQVNWLSGSMTLAGFKCEAGFPERDCDAIGKKYTEGSFVSAGWLTFTKGTDGWFAYNNAGIGYTITTDSDTLLYKASSALIPLNEQYIKTLFPSIQKLCSNAKTTVPSTIQKETLSTWKVQIPSCTVRVTFSEAGEDISITQQNGVTATGANGSTTAPTTTATGNAAIAPNNTSTPPNLKGSGYTYTSTRGAYSINFPSARITFNGINIQEDLGIKGLSCYVRLDVKDYNDKDNDNVWAAVAIYECISKEASSALASKASGYIFKTSKDGTKLFFIKTLNSVRTEFAQRITIQ